MTLGENRYGIRPWGERLRAWREDVKHWSRADFKEQIEATSFRLKEVRGHLIDTRLIAKWESGTVKRPQGAYLRVLASLGAPLPATANSSVVTEGDDGMDRRRFLRNAGVAVAAAVATPDMSYGGRSVPARVEPAHIREIQSAVQDLYLRDQQIGGATLAEAALNQYYDARHMLDEADYCNGVGDELMAIAGELAVCVGWLSYDAGNQRQARELYAEAFLLADQANNNRLSIQAIEKMTLQSVFIADRGRHRGAAREAVRLGSRGADLARFDTSPRLHALLGGRQAIAHAVMGDEQGFRTAILRAWREIDRAGPATGEEETWLQFVNHGEISVHEAKGYRYLGHADTAASLYRSSLEDDQLSPRNRLNYRAQLAATLASLGDLSGAVEEGLTVLTSLEESDSAMASPRTVAELEPIRRLAHLHRNDDFSRRFDQVEALAQ